MILKWMLSVALALGTILSAVQAEAATDQERAGARAAANSGADAYEAGRFKEALDLFTRAESLVHSPVHLSYIGQSQVQLGMLVQARETFLKLKREPLPADAHEALRRAVEEAATHLERIEPRLAFLTIKVSGAEAGEAVSVSLDGAVVAPALVGIPAPMNPGEHVVRATAPGKDSGEIKIALQEAQREELLVQLQASGQPAAAGTPDPAAPSGTPAGAGEEPVADTGTGGSSLAIPAYIALGVGAVGLGAGVYFSLDSKSAAKDADELCGGSREMCMAASGDRDRVNELNDQAGASQTLGIVGFVVAGVGVAAGVTLLVLDMGGGEEPAAQGLSVTPYVGFDRFGVVGRF